MLNLPPNFSNHLALPKDVDGVFHFLSIELTNRIADHLSLMQIFLGRQSFTASSPQKMLDLVWDVDAQIFFQKPLCAVGVD